MTEDEKPEPCRLRCGADLAQRERVSAGRGDPGSTGLINTDGVSIKEAAGEKVVLVEFWTYTCFNCQNAQPHINALYEKYSG